MRAGKSIEKKVLDGLAGAEKNLQANDWVVVVWDGEPNTASVLEDHLASGEKVALLDDQGNVLVNGQLGKEKPWLAGGRRWRSAAGALMTLVTS